MSDDNEPLYNESEIKTKLGSGTVKSEYVRIEVVLAIIAEIRAKIKESGIDAEDKKGNEELLKTLRAEYKDFASSHAVVLRWMVEARQYDERAFLMYARNHVKPSYKDRGEYWRCQAEYLVLLFKRLNPRKDLKSIHQYRNAVLESLKKDDKEFTAAKEEADKKMEEIKQRAVTARKDRLMKLIKLKQAAFLKNQLKSSVSED